MDAVDLAKNHRILYGGDEHEIKDNRLHARLTRPLLSKFEYSAVITTLAKYLFTINDIGKYILDEELNAIINPSELACRLLDKGKFDAILDRGIEKVHYSTLMKNPLWDIMIDDYFITYNHSVQIELVEALGL